MAGQAKEIRVWRKEEIWCRLPVRKARMLPQDITDRASRTVGGSVDPVKARLYLAYWVLGVAALLVGAVLLRVLRTNSISAETRRATQLTRTYRCPSLVEKRRELMQDWASYLSE